MILAGSSRLTLVPRTLAIFHAPSEGLATATRFESTVPHEWALLSLTEEAVDQSFPSLANDLRHGIGQLKPWSDREELFYQDIKDPPVPTDGLKHWYLAKSLEILSLHQHRNAAQAPLFCNTIKHKSHRYVQEALMRIRARYSEPLDLHELAEEIGCAPHYLSRLVKKNTGKTLSLHLRAIRIERAQQILASQKKNITETAYDVGYQSISHFSKAFGQETGLTPSEFLKNS